MTTLLLGPADQARRRGLRRMRAIALSLLLLAAVVFLLTVHRDGAWGFVNAAAEAAMVGALADWFAVTALFRHPLGVPMPHTAIIPTRKDALGRSLQEFVTSTSSTADVARDRVAAADVARRVGAWLEDAGHSTRVVSEVATATARALRVLDNNDVRSFVRAARCSRGSSPNHSAPWPAGCSARSSGRRAPRPVDIALVEAHAWLSANQKTVRAASRAGRRGGPRWLDDKVSTACTRRSLAWVGRRPGQPRHTARRRSTTC